MSAPDMESASTGFDPARWYWLLDKASPQLLSQLALHGKLLHLEWQQEKRRLIWLLIFSAMSFGFIVLALLFAGLAVLYLGQQNDKLVLMMWLLPLSFILMSLGCLVVVRQLQHKGQAAFSASCQELITDIQLLKRLV